MVQMLVSVKNVHEAEIALQGGADIIDLKDPDQGALGALPLSEIRSIIDFVDARKPISATIGDIPMDAELIVQAISQLQGLALSYIKVGFFKANDYRPCLESIRKLGRSSQPLIAVFFAELQYPETIIADIKQAGFIGIMLDTVNKDGKTYQDYFSNTESEKLANSIKAQNLFFGIAGSLKENNINDAKKVNPDFIGFRGGVCVGNQRRNNLNSAKIISIKNNL